MKDNHTDTDLKHISNMLDEAISDKQKLCKLISENLLIKNSFIKGDEFDQGRRNLLNYGHCLGHALETTSNYRIPHGIAVNLGIAFANIASKNRNLLSSDNSKFIYDNMIKKYIPIEMKEEEFDRNVILECLKKDKKRVGNDLTIVIPDQNMQLLKVTDFTFEEYNIALDDTKRLLFF